MRSATAHPRSPSLAGRCLRFGLALAFVAGLMTLLNLGPRLPGRAGDLLRSNLDQGVQATALFYMDLERMPEIERRLAGRSVATREPGIEGCYADETRPRPAPFPPPRSKAQTPP
jgi:hypothetical protein